MPTHITKGKNGGKDEAPSRIDLVRTISTHNMAAHKTLSSLLVQTERSLTDTVFNTPKTYE